MDAMTAMLMSIGTGTASGLRPYLTVLVMSVAGLAVPDSTGGFLHQVDAAIPPAIANPWVAVICLVLALGDGGLDKVIGVNLPLEGINQVLRPVFGVLVGVGLGSQVNAGTMVVAGLLGGATALPVSLGKGGATAGSTALAPSATLQVLRSIGEDIGAVVLAVLAIVAPLLAAVLALAVVVMAVKVVVMVRRALRRRRGSGAV